MRMIDMYDSKNMKFWRGINFLLLIAGSLFMMAPLFWMLSIALKSMDEIYRGEFSFIPDDIQFSNFIEIFNVIPFGTYFLNTSLFTIYFFLSYVFLYVILSFFFDYYIYTM